MHSSKGRFVDDFAAVDPTIWVLLARCNYPVDDSADTMAKDDGLQRFVNDSSVRRSLSTIMPNLSMVC
jgi:hypothetical protein